MMEDKVVVEEWRRTKKVNDMELKFGDMFLAEQVWRSRMQVSDRIRYLWGNRIPVFYDATIIGVDERADTFQLKYDGYGDRWNESVSRKSHLIFPPSNFKITDMKVDNDSQATQKMQISMLAYWKTLQKRLS
eukprot:TRINITY_DN11364_c0_g1_i1.p1 TRINITY_DN11364_c0_g1~~TRINITY_DN11364_c0_g1_i1.p1  ORF type:complete len:143 (-),score=16.27 TRINITY_DN11364_c0_g1_i1:218-613(-)